VVPRGIADIVRPVKTFLNCTMPALVNMSVGSLRGTSGDDGTISCPSRAKNARKFVLISLTPLIPQLSNDPGVSCPGTAHFEGAIAGRV
jgi:hypothetical protein